MGRDKERKSHVSFSLSLYIYIYLHNNMDKYMCTCVCACRYLQCIVYMYTDIIYIYIYIYMCLCLHTKATIEPLVDNTWFCRNDDGHNTFFTQTEVRVCKNTPWKQNKQNKWYICDKHCRSGTFHEGGHEEVWHHSDFVLHCVCENIGLAFVSEIGSRICLKEA